MRTYRLFLLSASIIAALASCAKEQVVETDGKSADKLTIEAFFADDMGTKNCIDDAGTIYWTPNDSISVFFGDYSFPFYSYNSKPVTRANFIGSAWIATGSNAESDETTDEYNYWGVYPLRTNDFRYRTVKNGEGVMCFVDENQTAVDGTFDRSTFVTVACSHDYTKLAFYNLCGGVRFKVTSSDIDMVTFSGNNGEALGGEVLVKMDAEGHPYPAEHYSDIKTIRLQAPSGTTFKPGVWYYIVTLPTELSNGFTMKFISKKNNRMAVLKKESKVSIARSRFGNLSNPESGLEYKAYDGSEDKRQLENGIFLKSVKMTDEGHFEFELDYPSIYVQRLFEKYKVKLDYFDETFINDDIHLFGVDFEFEDDFTYEAFEDYTYSDELLLEYLAENSVHTVVYDSSTGNFGQTTMNLRSSGYLGCNLNDYYFFDSAYRYGHVHDYYFYKLSLDGKNEFQDYGCIDNIPIIDYSPSAFLLDGIYPAIMGNTEGNACVVACLLSKDNIQSTIEPSFEIDNEFQVGTSKYIISDDIGDLYHVTVKNGKPTFVYKEHIGKYIYSGVINYHKEKQTVIFIQDHIQDATYFILREDGSVEHHNLRSHRFADSKIAFSPDYKKCFIMLTNFRDFSENNPNYITVQKHNLLTGEDYAIEYYVPDVVASSLGDQYGQYGYLNDKFVCLLHALRESDNQQISIVIDLETEAMSFVDGIIEPDESVNAYWVHDGYFDEINIYN